MVARKTPRFPRKETVLKKRLLIQAVPLLLLVTGALFYAFNHPSSVHDEIAAALREKTEEAGAAQASASGSGQGSVQNFDQNTGHNSADNSGQRSARPSGQKGAQTSGQAPGQRDAQTPARAAAPGSFPSVKKGENAAASFTGWSLDEIAAEMTRRHGGKRPALWGEHLPGITSSLVSPQGQNPIIALTLDACGGAKGASFDAAVIEFLQREKIPATIFVTSVWLKNNAEILRGLSRDPLFEIAAHGQRHKPASVNGRSVYGISGTSSIAELVREVEENARDIERITGERPRWFRSGTAYYDEVALAVIADLGMGVAGYSIAGDEGATLPAAGVKAKLVAATGGDILLLHLNKPRSGTRQGLLEALPVLLERGARFVRLSDSPGRE